MPDPVLETCVFYRTSTLTGKTHSMALQLHEGDYDRITNRGSTPIQNVVDYLTDDEREFIISGITPAEWAEHFGNGEE